MENQISAKKLFGDLECILQVVWNHINLRQVADMNLQMADFYSTLQALIEVSIEASVVYAERNQRMSSWLGSSVDSAEYSEEMEGADYFRFQCLPAYSSSKELVSCGPFSIWLDHKYTHEAFGSEVKLL